MGYAFEMFFDSHSEKKIIDIWQKLSEQNLPSFMLENNCKPHISLSVYNELDIEVIKAYLANYCKCNSRFKLFLGFIGTFISNENVIFIAPIITEQLIKFHASFHSAFRQFQASIWPYYLPSRWQPHCTMAIEIPKEKYMQCFKTIRNNFIPFEITIESIGLVEFMPIKLIQEYKLNEG